MKNKINLLVSVVCIVIFCIALQACSQSKIEKITDIPRFSEMTQDGTEKINVEFDNNTGEPFYFTIEDDATITEIIGMIFDAELENKGKELYDGDNTYITVIQGDKEYRLSVRMNKEKDNYYSFKNSDLQDKVYALARDAGAYDNGEQ